MKAITSRFVSARRVDPRRPAAVLRRAGLAVLGVMLLSVACQPSPSDRRQSIYDLSAEPSERNTLRIRGYLDDTDRDVRATALYMLVGLDVPDAVELSLRGLQDDDGFVRATAVKLVGDTEDPRQSSVLVERLLADPDPVVRQRAAEALARVGGDQARAGLGQGIQDPMENVRLASVTALGELGAVEALETLAQLLREDAVWEVRARAAQALGTTGDPRARVALEEALDDPNEFVRSASANALRVHETVSQP